jgi:hypothetical protein
MKVDRGICVPGTSGTFCCNVPEGERALGGVRSRVGDDGGRAGAMGAMNCEFGNPLSGVRWRIPAVPLLSLNRRKPPGKTSIPPDAPGLF